METINGVVNYVKFYNDTNGYSIIELTLDYKKNPSSKKVILGNRVKVVGYLDHKPFDGEEYSFEGDYVRDSQYGLQFEFKKFNRKAIKTELGIITYLSSDLFPGIGTVVAKKIVDKIGTNALDLIKEDPNILEKLDLSSKQQETIIKGIKQDDLNRENILFFLDNGITLEMANKIVNALGMDARKIVLDNPYIIMDKVEHFGFKKNDELALKLGVARNSLIRLKALFCYRLREYIYNNGNSYINKMAFYTHICDYIQEEIDKNTYELVINDLLDQKKIFIDEHKNLYDRKLYVQEIELAIAIATKLKNFHNPSDLDTKQVIRYTEKDIIKNYLEVKQQAKINFNPEQEQAILSAFKEPIVIITGGPGTGKTTIVKAIVEMYIKLNQNNENLLDYIALVAPTGKAAKRLKETTGQNAMTIHRYLGYTGSLFAYNKYNKTKEKLIIVDEASMMDLPLASQLICSMADDARIIIVGDVDQLPSVGPGQVLKDLIDSKQISTFRLTHIHRQKEDSNIISLAYDINQGHLHETILDKKNDRVFIQTDNEHLASLLVDATMRYVNKGYDIKKDLQILIPKYLGPVGIDEMNNLLQKAVNPSNKEEMKYYDKTFRIGDKVIQLTNRPEKGVMNGDIGYIDSFIHQNLKIVGLRVAFDEIVDYNNDELEDLKLAYAISVHKAQGSEFDIVIMPICSHHYMMLKRKLIYTAVTRAKKSLILIGNLKIMQHAIAQIENSRLTILKQKIIQFMNDNINEIIPELPQENNDKNLNKKIGNASLEQLDDVLEIKTVDLNNQIEDHQIYQVGDVILHKYFGKGEVIKKDQDILEIKFEQNNEVKKIANNYPGMLKIS